MALRDVATGRILAVLQAPKRETVHACRFSADGAFLVVSGERSVQVWHVAGIRARLDKIGLDWRSTVEAKATLREQVLATPSAN